MPGCALQRAMRLVLSPTQQFSAAPVPGLARLLLHVPHVLSAAAQIHSRRLLLLHVLLLECKIFWLYDGEGVTTCCCCCPCKCCAIWRVWWGLALQHRRVARVLRILPHVGRLLLLLLLY